jgi:hypothetical protein
MTIKRINSIFMKEDPKENSACSDKSESTDYSMKEDPKENSARNQCW